MLLRLAGFIISFVIFQRVLVAAIGFEYHLYDVERLAIFVAATDTGNGEAKHREGLAISRQSGIALGESDIVAEQDVIHLVGIELTLLLINGDAGGFPLLLP